MLIFDLKALERIFNNNVATKTVSETDISKAAYVVNDKQRKILKRASFNPGTHPPNVTIVPLNILGADEVINASYYGSQRKGSGRSPEYRMGRFIDRLSVGDKIAFAIDGRDVFICKVSVSGERVTDIIKAYEDTAVSVNERLSLEELMSRVKKVKLRPDSRTIEMKSYYRDPAIIAVAHLRSEYKCEMPGCEYVGFQKSGGGKFIETHHIKPLSEKGEDSIFNVAALCPNCHKKAHYAHNRKQKSQTLREAVQQANKRLGIKTDT